MLAYRVSYLTVRKILYLAILEHNNENPRQNVQDHSSCRVCCWLQSSVSWWQLGFAMVSNYLLYPNCSMRGWLKHRLARPGLCEKKKRHKEGKNRTINAHFLWNEPNPLKFLKCGKAVRNIKTQRYNVYLRPDILCKNFVTNVQKLLEEKNSNVFTHSTAVLQQKTVEVDQCVFKLDPK